MKRIQSVFNRISLLPYLPVIGLPLVLFAPHILGGKALFWGTPALQFVPWWSFAWETLLSGHLPLWNPMSGMGAPLAANLQSALFYPPNWMYLLLYGLGGVTWLAWGQALGVALHLVWSGLGMVALVQRLGMSRLAQTVSALAFALSGYLVARAWFASINAAVAWLPWVLLFSLDLARQPQRLSPLLKLGVVIGLQLLAGHAQTSWYTLLLAGMWAGFWAWQTARLTGEQPLVALRSLAKTWARLGAAVVVGVVLSAVQLLPTAEYLWNSQRAEATAYSLAMTYSFWPWRFLGLLAPNLFGSPAQGDYWGYGNYWEDAIYIGIVPLLLAVGVVFREIFGRERRLVSEPDHAAFQGTSSLLAASMRPFVLFSAFVVALSFLLALGENTPVFPWLYWHVPTFDMFQAPTRISIWAVFSLSLLAGVGVERWRRPVGRGLYWTRLGTAGALAVSMGAGLGWLLLARELRPTFVPAVALAGWWGLGMGVLSLTAAPSGESLRSSLWAWGVALWVAMDLLVAGWGLNPAISLEFYARSHENASQLRDQLGDKRLFLLPDDEERLRYQRFFVFKTFDPDGDWEDLKATLLPNLNVLEGIPAVNNYDPLVPTRYARWMQAWRGIDPSEREDLLDLMGVGVVAWEDPRAPHGVRFQTREAPGRARWVPCARSASDEEAAWNLVMGGQVDFRKETVVEGQRSLPNQGCDSTVLDLEVVDPSPNQVLITVKTSTPGWLLLSDTFYPGWQAKIDGQPVPVYRADHLFRGVKVPEGEHTVEFLYRPASFYLGFGVSLAGWLAVLGLVACARRRNQRNHNCHPAGFPL